VIKKVTKERPAQAARRTNRQRKPKINQKERILREATIHLIRKHGGLLVATDLREEPIEGSRTWIITITLRCPTGHEGYVGDLLYDGRSFALLTQESVMDQRVRQIEADPEGIRRWNEYRASTVRAGKP